MAFSVVLDLADSEAAFRQKRYLRYTAKKNLCLKFSEISYLKDKLGGINKSKYILHKEY